MTKKKKQKTVGLAQRQLAASQDKKPSGSLKKSPDKKPGRT